MNKKISFALVAIMLAFSMVTFVGCEDATKDDPAPQNLALPTDAPEGAIFLYGGTPKVGEWQNWGMNNVVDEAYAADASYNPCILLTSATGWGNGYPWAFDAGSLTGMTTFSFKVKSEDYDYVAVKMPGSSLIGDAAVQIFFDGRTAGTTVTDVAGAPGWKKVVVNVATVWGNLDAATQCAIYYQVIPVVHGSSTPEGEIMYLADIYLY